VKTLIVFDLDGTLAESKAVAEQHAVKLSRESTTDDEIADVAIARIMAERRKKRGRSGGCSVLQI
jgi:beta-phosphoglucomutase-like phosphatase (HAD superfamily)